MTPPDEPAKPTEPQSAHHFHPTLSRNQKKRSKLGQVSVESEEGEPKPEPPPEPASRPPVAPVRRTRIKRSGHMHDDLTQPLPEKKRPEPGSEY